MIVALIADLRWECWHSNRGCYDGQGGIVLIVLAPFMFVVADFLGLCGLGCVREFSRVVT